IGIVSEIDRKRSAIYHVYFYIALTLKTIKIRIRKKRIPILFQDTAYAIPFMNRHGKAGSL
ncbi:MAG: hypothetical protein ACLTDX_13860, partial [[Clostridium] innocuum]